MRRNATTPLGTAEFIWQRPGWPALRYDHARLANSLAQVSQALGVVLGRLEDAGLPLRARASLSSLTDDVLKTSEIEGEHLSVSAVRSSLARRLGVDIGALAPIDRHVDGVVAMIVDATSRADQPLTRERVFGWHAALFPTGRSGLERIRVGAWRDDAHGAMQVVSGGVGRPRVHFEAPPASQLEQETARFFVWANADTGDPLLLKAGLAHLWFVTLHPFDDGNGRVARAIGDWLLARADGSTQRVYSLSARIQKERRAYYAALEGTQRGPLDITEWLEWFLATLHGALDDAQVTLDTVLSAARFWQRRASTPLNQRQIKVLTRLLGGFVGRLTSTKWAAMTKCSGDTALRDLNELVSLGVLRRSEAGGRSTSYELAPREA